MNGWWRDLGQKPPNTRDAGGVSPHIPNTSLGLLVEEADGSRSLCRPMIDNPPLFKGLKIKIPILVPIKIRGFSNQGSTLSCPVIPRYVIPRPIFSVFPSSSSRLDHFQTPSRITKHEGGVVETCRSSSGSQNSQANIGYGCLSELWP